MVTREEVREEYLRTLENEINSGKKKWEDVAVISLGKGKNSWTYREIYDAVEKDEEPENFGCNPIDKVLRYLEWKEKKPKTGDDYKKEKKEMNARNRQRK